MSNYQDLDIYKISLALFYEIHPASLLLPKHELYELGSQIRRSSDSVNSNIVEGYGRNRYKADFIRFLVFSHSSCLETKGHLIKIDHLYKGLIPNIDRFITDYDNLGAKIFNFIKYVEQNWKT
ncbi:four helix bundle protein [Flavobacterium macrobrachii]|uniref:Four helix bundle protein n=1 Tax=Flavobacterium macrobrachii TaxID=591204 RepID=A0ABS2CX51_9FLAO|nr:four helix bundle protein [Flavobacterium macrobrachii]MBM6499479.1 four helix bundle protein [Flavobacterium macrobrachii]